MKMHVTNPIRPCSHRALRSGLALMLVSAVCTAQQADTNATDPLARYSWSEVVDGMQLSLSIGVNTEKLAESTSLLGLTVILRNVSDEPASVFMEYDQSTYDFEYEVDGTWYAFEPMTPVRSLLTELREGTDLSVYERQLASGAVNSTILSVPLAGRSTGLQLHAITDQGPGTRFEAKPGPHVVRVRPGRAAIGDRPAPVSNAVTISFRTQHDVGTGSQKVTFTPAPDTPLRELRLARGSAEDEVFINSVLARPPSPGTAGPLIAAEALQIWDPIPGYELYMPRRRNEPEPTLPQPTSRRYYLAIAAGELAGLIDIESSAAGPSLHSIGTSPDHAEPVYRALRQMAGMPELRGIGYEPRIVQVRGTRTVPSLIMLWLHATGAPDLFLWPRPARFSRWTKLESNKVYTWNEFLRAAQALPVEPQHDEAWAVRAAMSCTMDPSTLYPNALLPDQAEVEIGLSDQLDRIIWYVFIPEPPNPERVTSPQPGAALLVDEADASCKPVTGRH